MSKVDIGDFVCKECNGNDPYYAKGFCENCYKRLGARRRKEKKQGLGEPVINVEASE